MPVMAQASIAGASGQRRRPPATLKSGGAHAVGVRSCMRWNKLTARAFFAASLIGLSACTYGPEESTAHITNVATRPGTHDLAFGVDFRRIRQPTGINAFPNGGIPRVLEREARIYLCRVDEGVMRELAAVADYDGIPSSAGVWIAGWKGGDLYFRLFGYERDASGGNDLDKPVSSFYRVSDDGVLARVSELPEDLAIQSNSGPAGAPPFLRYSLGHRDIEIVIDGRLSERGADARVVFPENSAKPLLQMLR